jgi:hypothetical protein
MEFRSLTLPDYESGQLTCINDGAYGTTIRRLGNALQR